MSVRVPSMSVLPPVRRDRVIAQLPQCYSKKAAVQTKDEFNFKVKTACQEQRTGTVGFKIAKVIVVGDLAVGKTCLINRWDTAGQERFKCIASTYYRGAQTIIIVFDVNDVASLGHARQWLEDALKENDPTNVQLFLVGTKKDLSSPAQYSQIEQDATKLAEEIKAEYWALSSLTGENVKEFFFRVASLAFEVNVLAEIEKSGSRHIGDVIKINSNSNSLYATSKKKQSNCCQ
ncbi:ras-related protein Rab-34 isoform X2 [Oncorhynchus tshawytscha]|uniref:ras-related protein Rab-34 isoform X2 n=1 Tax=Oncorhynchus tshawytscha TaxID=74940 RepID=UPI000D09E98C|nr:ras-related protein Rab-34 isoform X2 [Oncorhynchus tshawytscha]